MVGAQDRIGVGQRDGCQTVVGIVGVAEGVTVGVGLGVEQMVAVVGD